MYAGKCVGLTFNWKKWCPGWESNLSGGLILRKLLILRNSKMEKNYKNAEARYTAGTRQIHKFAHAIRCEEGRSFDPLLRGIA